jgi:hypothetical protein
MSIKTNAEIIRDETGTGANTATRVGGNLVEISDDLIAKQTAIDLNTAKVGYTDALVSANSSVVANTAKVGISTGQASAIVTNTAKVSFDSTSSTRLANTSGTNTGDETLATIQTKLVSTNNLAEGTNNLYFLASRVLASVLTGLSTATATVITATDTVLIALGKLQGQLGLKANDSEVVKLTGNQTIAGVKTFTPVLTATANNQELVALNVTPSFVSSTFSGLKKIALKLFGDFTVNKENGVVTFAAISSIDEGHIVVSGTTTTSQQIALFGRGGFGLGQAQIVTNSISLSFVCNAIGDMTLGTPSYSNAGAMKMFSTGNLVLKNSSVSDNGVDKLQVNGSGNFTSSVQVGNNALASSVLNAGAIRYRTDANNSYMEMSMQTGASLYAWVIIKQNTF